MHHPGELPASPRRRSPNDFPAAPAPFSTIAPTYPNRLDQVTTSRRSPVHQVLTPQIHSLFYD
jgi:hypothetical protein